MGPASLAASSWRQAARWCGLNLVVPSKVAFRNTSPATEIVDQPARRLKLDWAEPGDPPNADYKSVRAKPLAKPISYPGLTREVELELVRRWRENGDEMALDRLVGAHRPMVVNMARHRQRLNGTSLAALVEYGMLGVRLAAEPPRPSQTKKAKVVGFDPATGHRFSTYARHHADKQMRAALSDVRWEPSPDFNSEPNLALAAGKAAEEMEGWRSARSLRGTASQAPVVVALQQRKPYFKCYVPWTLWNPSEPERKARPRNFIKHPRTKRELDNRNAHYARSSSVLQTYVNMAKGGLHDPKEDRKDEDDDKKVPRRARKRMRSVIYLCLNPLASIYLLRGKNTARFFNLHPPGEHQRWLLRLTTAKYFRRLPVGAKQELALLAKSRYQSPCSLARQAIMAEIEKAQNAGLTCT